MKIKILLVSLLLTNVMMAQVGVGTSDPKVTLHIEGKPTVTTEKDGLLIPKITGDQLKAKTYTSSEVGTMLYISSVPTGTIVGTQVENVNAIGFYYLANSGSNFRWTKMIASSFDKTDDEWINSGTSVLLGKKADGTTSRDTATDVTFTDSGYLGLGTSSPSAGIHVYANNNPTKDDIKIESYNTSTGGNLLFQSGGFAANAPANLVSGNLIGQINFNGRVGGSVNTSHARIFSAYKGTSGGDITLSAGGDSNNTLHVSETQRVGIATNAPNTTLDVNGTYSIREQGVAIANNLASFTATHSQVVLTGTATGNITLSPTAGAAGQRMVVVNTTTGGFKAILGTYEIQNDQAVDFVFSGNKWRALSNGELSNTKRLYTGKAKIPPHTATSTAATNGSYDTPDWKLVSAPAGTSARFAMFTVLAASYANIRASNRLFTYEYQGIAFNNLEKLHPMLTAGNDSSNPDTFSANFVKLENVNGKTRITVSLTRNDLISDYNVGSYNLSEWQGTFFLNITLLETN